MSTLHTTDRPDRASGGSSKVMKAVAAIAAVGVLAFGANAIGKSGSSATTGNGAQNSPGVGQGGAPPQMGTDVTGATLTKLESAATAKYPGRVEHAMQLPDGSYVVHVIRSDGSGEVHVLVSKDFRVTGVGQGGPPSGAPPAGQTAPSTSGTTSSS